MGVNVFVWSRRTDWYYGLPSSKDDLNGVVTCDPQDPWRGEHDGAVIFQLHKADMFHALECFIFKH